VIGAQKQVMGGFATGHMEGLLSADALAHYVDWALQILPYFDLLDREGDGIPRLRSFESLLAQPPQTGSLKGRYMIEGAKKWVDLAIAQQSVLAGEGSIAALYAEMDDAMSESPDCAVRATHPVCLIQGNPMLARNFMLYAMRKEVGAAEMTLPAYAVAVAMKNDASMLRKVTRKAWNFQWSDASGWSVKIGSTQVALPTPSQLFDDTLAHSSEMNLLLQVRGRLADALAMMDLQQSITLEQQRALGWSLLFP
jgi:hypothetical protein